MDQPPLGIEPVSSWAFWPWVNSLNLSAMRPQLQLNKTSLLNWRAAHYIRMWILFLVENSWMRECSHCQNNFSKKFLFILKKGDPIFQWNRTSLGSFQFQVSGICFAQSLVQVICCLLKSCHAKKSIAKHLIHGALQCDKVMVWTRKLMILAAIKTMPLTTWSTDQAVKQIRLNFSTTDLDFDNFVVFILAWGNSRNVKWWSKINH